MFLSSLPSRYIVTFIDDIVDTQVYDERDRVTSCDVISLKTVGENDATMSYFVPCESRPFYASVVGNERVTAEDHWQDVRLITFDVTDSNLRFVAFAVHIMT